MVGDKEGSEGDASEGKQIQKNKDKIIQTTSKQTVTIIVKDELYFMVKIKYFSFMIVKLHLKIRYMDCTNKMENSAQLFIMQE